LSNFYKVLGLSIGADPAQIKAAFHRLAKSCHPDVNAGDASAEKRFREVTQAYHILGDPAKRAAYDSGLEHKHAEARRRMRKAMGVTAASFTVTVGCGLYFSLSDVATSFAERPQATELASNYKAQRERALHLYGKGMEQIERGDVLSARMFFALAAEAGLAQSMRALAGTHDLIQLAKTKVLGMQADVDATRKGPARAADRGAVADVEPAVGEEWGYLGKPAEPPGKPAD
jgi:curved DNA-binding protein CbpA